GVGHAHLETIYEQRAAAHPHADHPELATAVGWLRQRSQAGALVVVTTNMAPPGDIQLVQRLRGRFGMVILTLVEAAPSTNGAHGAHGGNGSSSTPANGTRRGWMTSAGPVVRGSATQPFAAAWNTAIFATSAGRAARSRARS